MTNSADPAQLPSSEPTDLDLHCLLRRGVLCSAREGLIVLSAPQNLELIKKKKKKKKHQVISNKISLL